jgi:VCBS repeat protein
MMRTTRPFLGLVAPYLLAAIACSGPDPQADVGIAPPIGAPRAFPRFERVLQLETTNETSANVNIGDVNGDGHLDLVLAKGRHWPLVDRVLLGDGRGRIAATFNLGGAADRTYSGLLVDLDGDTDLDVIVSNDDPDPKLVYLNDGRGHFGVGSTFGRAEWETRHASVADLNDDGQPDIIAANRVSRGAPANYVCLNRGRGRFDADCLPFSHEPATTIAAADFNRDGRIDLAVPHRDGGQSYVYLNGGKATFLDSGRIPFGPADAHIRVAEAVDLNGDGILDLAAIDESRGVEVYFGHEDATFSSRVEIADGTVTPYALAVRDLNGDGHADLVVGHLAAPSTIYFNDGSGRHYSPVSFGDANGDVYGFAIADLDEDGHLDIAVARSEGTNVVYFGGSAAARD